MPRSPTTRWRWIRLLLLVPAIGCVTARVDRHPEAPVDLPAEATARFALPEEGRWWTQFRDAELDRLVATALTRNLELEEAWARLENARALEGVAAAPLWPALAVGVESRVANAPLAAPGAGGGKLEPAYGASAAASYELDLWGKIRAGRAAAHEDFEAVRAEYAAASVTLSASVVERWLDLREQRALQALLDAQLETHRKVLQAVRRQLGLGLASLSDVIVQENQLTNLSLQRRVAEAQEELAAQALAALIAEAPGTLNPRGDTLPTLPPLASDAILVGDVRKRPDVRAAERRVVAADYRVAAAIGERFPSLKLDLAAISFGPPLSGLFESIVARFIGTLAQPLLQGGRIQAQVEANRASYDAALARYGQSLLDGLVEIAGALARLRAEAWQIARLSDQLGDLETAVTVASERYRVGLGDYLSVLTAVQTKQRAEQSLLSARRRRLSARVALCRALGGHLTGGLVAPQAGDA